MNDVAQTIGLIVVVLAFGSVLFGWFESLSLFLLKYFPPGIVIARFSRSFALKENNIQIGQVVDTQHGKYVFLNREVCLFRRGYGLFYAPFLKGVLRFADDTLTFEARFPVGILGFGLAILLGIALMLLNSDNVHNDIGPLGVLLILGVWLFGMWFVFERTKADLIEVYHEIKESIGGDAAANPFTRDYFDAGDR